MSRRPAKERAAAPARRLDVLESFGRDEEVVDLDVDGVMRAALSRMALSEVK
jgi:hypothetical protein